MNKIGYIVILLPKENKWDSFMRAVDMFSDDFHGGRKNKGYGAGTRSAIGICLTQTSAFLNTS